MNHKIAHFLRQIPQSNQEPIPIEQLADNIDKAAILGFLQALAFMGMVTIDAEERVQAVSQTAKYMLTSLSYYLDHDQKLILDWFTRGVNQDNSHNPLQNAATLLYALEQQRLTIQQDAAPSRVEHVAQVLIKRTNPENGQSEFLCQYDNNARQYQLIGGRKKDHEDLLLDTIIREIEEETIDSLQYEIDYTLACVAENISPPDALSPTFGALTRYHFWIYHMMHIKKPLTLHPNDAWISTNQLLSENGISDANLFRDRQLFHLIDQAVGGLISLADSFDSAH